jgi:hypothetical protein
MRVTVSSFALPKEGNMESEYEDAFYPRWQGERVLDRVRAAVADGATEGSFSRVWARMLAESFYANSSLRFEDTFRHALEKWELWLPQYLSDRERSGRPMLWFEEAKLERGAYATFLGIRLRTRERDASSGQWGAVALGDSCLFQIRDDSLITSFPIGSAESFDSSPPLVPSRPDDLEVVVGHAQRTTGEWSCGDSFYLATDALSSWFLAAYEAGERPWRSISDFDTEAIEPFPEWVAARRHERSMRNDDVTLTRIDIH